jgi:hypothetical protein
LKNIKKVKNTEAAPILAKGMTAKAFEMMRQG